MTYPAANGTCAINTNLHNALSGLEKGQIEKFLDVKSGFRPINTSVISYELSST
jgi:hypothetical protein